MRMRLRRKPEGGAHLTPSSQHEVCSAVGISRLHGGQVHHMDLGCVGDDVSRLHREHLHHPMQLAVDALPVHVTGCGAAGGVYKA